MPDSVRRRSSSLNIANVEKEAVPAASCRKKSRREWARVKNSMVKFTTLVMRLG